MKQRDNMYKNKMKNPNDKKIEDDFKLTIK